MNNIGSVTLRRIGAVSEGDVLENRYATKYAPKGGRKLKVVDITEVEGFGFYFTLRVVRWEVPRAFWGGGPGKWEIVKGTNAVSLSERTVAKDWKKEGSA
jgi:hypothetical protein